MNCANLLERIRKQAGGDANSRDARILYALVCMHIAWPELFTHFANDPTVDTVTCLENWEYLDNLPEAQKLLDRVPDKEKFKNDVSTFFDTLFSVLDENDDGQIDSGELEPVVEVMMLVRMTAVEGRERPRDFFIRRVRENNNDESALVNHSLDDLDLVVDAFELACVERSLGVGDDARLSLVKILSAVDNYLGGNRCSRTRTIIVPLHVGNLTTNVGR